MKEIQPSLLSWESILLTELIKVTPVFSCQKFKKFDISIILEEKNLIFSLFTLKKHINFNYNLLSCISGSDLMKKKFRFILTYELLSLTFNSRLRVKLFVNEYAYVPSSIFVFVNANWWEREIWDLYGIYFDNHPDLRRILTDYGFEGYPLRKDFPLFGFRELRYDNNKKIILSEPIFLSQEFRQFNYETPW